MAPHSSTFAWKIPWTEEPGRLQSMGSLESVTTEWLHFHFSFSCMGEGNGNPLQCSCLENPRDGEAWWAAVYGVAHSWTRLKRLSSSSRSIHISSLSWTSLLPALTSQPSGSSQRAIYNYLFLIISQRFYLMIQTSLFFFYLPLRETFIPWIVNVTFIEQLLGDWQLH